MPTTLRTTQGLLTVTEDGDDFIRAFNEAICARTFLQGVNDDGLTVYVNLAHIVSVIVDA